MAITIRWRDYQIFITQTNLDFIELIFQFVDRHIDTKHIAKALSVNRVSKQQFYAFG